MGTGSIAQSLPLSYGAGSVEPLPIVYALIARFSFATRSGGGLAIPWEFLACAAAISMTSFASFAPFTSKPQLMPMSAHRKLAMDPSCRDVQGWA